MFSLRNVFSKVTNSNNLVSTYRFLRSNPTPKTFSKRTSKPLEQTPGLSALIKPTLFAFGFSGVSFVFTSVWQYENMRVMSLEKKIKDWMSTEIFPKKRGKFREEMKELWNNLTEGEKLFIPILFLNSVVWTAWRIPSLGATMSRYFCSSATGPSVCLPMLLSTFSHHSALHLGVNMFALHSFSSTLVSALGKEQFLHLYLSGGVFSSLFSLIHKVAFKTSGLSLGASGAICAIIATFASIKPDAQMTIVLLPFFTFTALTALKGLMVVDSLGILLKWRVLDHAAHLGGCIFGLWWIYYGHYLVWGRREEIMNVWHELIRKID